MDNRRLYRTIRMAMKQLFPTEPKGNFARQLTTMAAMVTGIGEAQKMWPHGNEPAFTIIPNFLLTGIAAMLVGFAIIVWSLGFVHKKNGPTILLFLFIILLLVGGGVAQVLFFPWIWLVSTRINRPLVWWRKALPEKVQGPLGRMWLGCLMIGVALMVFVFGIAITGYVPTLNDPEAVLSVMLLCLATELVILPLTFISGFAKDISQKPDAAPGEQ